MSVLTAARKALFERRYFGGHRSEDEIERHYVEFNRLPPTRTRYCKKCGDPVRWYRAFPEFDTRTGEAVYVYHLRCPRSHDVQRALDELREHATAPLTKREIEYAVILADGHYDAQEWRRRTGDAASYDPEDLW